jgi:hypothetical protein
MLWRDTNPYNISKERNEDFTQFYVVLHVTNIPDLEGWSLIIGDCIHNFRSALDHMVSAIAIHESGKNPPPKEGVLAFPIADNPSDFKKASGRIETLSAPARAAIESVQPYNRTHPAVPLPLALLRDFANTDKHKLLRLAFASQHTGEVSLTIPSSRSGEGRFLANYGELKDNTVLMSWVFDKPEPSVQFDKIDLGIGISLLTCPPYLVQG